MFIVISYGYYQCNTNFILINNYNYLIGKKFILKCQFFFYFSISWAPKYAYAIK